MDKEIFEVGDLVICQMVLPLPRNNYAPPLNKDEMYKVLEIIKDAKGNQHLNVGLKSSLNYVSSFETGEHLPKGNEIHWCHPSRFKLHTRFYQEEEHGAHILGT